MKSSFPNPNVRDVVRQSFQPNELSYTDYILKFY